MTRRWDPMDKTTKLIDMIGISSAHFLSDAMPMDEKGEVANFGRFAPSDLQDTSVTRCLALT
jgi:hypothetical protein